MKALKTLICILFLSIGLFSQNKDYKSKAMNISEPIMVTELERSVPSTLAAPPNDNCSNAIQITTLNGTCNGAYTLNSATTDLYFFGCQNNTKQVWFYFIAQGPNVEITVQGGTITNPEIVLFSGNNICTGAPTITYGGYCASFAPFTSNYVSLTNQTCTNPLTVGQTYYFTVDSWGTKGTFCVSVNNPVPNPPGTDCGTATTICSNTSLSGNDSLWGSCDLTTNTIGGCLGQYGEVNSSWYVVYIDPTSPANGTLTFTISPSNGTDDYDYSIWKGATCTLGAPNSCNFSSTVANTGLATGNASTSQGSGGTPWNAPLVTQPGDVYIVLINGYTASANTFNFNFGGTAILGCNPPPILPIELLSFNIKKISNYNLLEWKTATEINNKEFKIQRSINGLDWINLGYINGAGTSEQVNSYTFKDSSYNKSINYYRIIQIDYNGFETILPIKFIDNTSNNPIKIKSTDVLGQTVNSDYKGVIFTYWSDGSIQKELSN